MRARTRVRFVTRKGDGVKDWNQMEMTDLETGVVTTYSCDCLESGTWICDVGGDNRRRLEKPTSCIRIDKYNPKPDRFWIEGSPPVFDMLDGKEQPTWLLGHAMLESGETV